MLIIITRKILGTVTGKWQSTTSGLRAVVGGVLTSLAPEANVWRWKLRYQKGVISDRS